MFMDVFSTLIKGPFEITIDNFVKLKDGGNCLLLLSSHSKPYIMFKENTGKEIFFNSKNSEITEALYKELKKWIH